MTTLPTQNSDLLAVYTNTNVQQCGISTREGIWEKGSVQGFITFSAAQRRVEIYVFEYISFDNVKIFLVNKNV
jgi:hypothetical protein